ncbi:NADPH-dependent oxidoreductase [Kineobactrum sediminis]|uniref:NADPH-dependent oxidoreductase n=1 Tax=Kineobactrum sediminis TaxID=1905677 RepID=A0A2N5Y7K2_9GAMM|nr:NAD(P)H-dependent oxidoreductase [Kineobactrum sediminis]PLW84372.1 NADPH-dependent oxidoreductase [Kineobactrum sediminis]
MKIGIISGSHRPNSQSAKIARHIERTLQQQELCEATWVYELADNPLPLWEEGVWNAEDAAWQKLLQPLREQLHSCDGLIIISPEWHGMATPGLKNFLLMWTGGEELAHKPALIVTVSVADGGSYPVAELRMSSYKNSRICYLPEHLIIRYVDTVFNEDPATNNADAQAYFEARLSYCLEMLREYSLAFRQIRNSGKVSLAKYSSGM